MTKRGRRIGWSLIALVLAAVLAGPASRGFRSLMMTRRALATFVAMLASANAQDLDAVRSLCTDRYLGKHPLSIATEGGVVGLPRNIHKNFQVWREGDEVWLCPTDRVGPVYRFVLEGGTWKFDGLVGLLRPGGRVEQADEADTPVSDFPEVPAGNIRPCGIPLSRVQVPRTSPPET